MNKTIKTIKEILNTDLKALLKPRKAHSFTVKAESSTLHPKKEKRTFYPLNEVDLIKEFQEINIKENEISSSGKMEIPYSKDLIAQATFINPNFFTLSTNKKKSDQVMVKFRTIEGINFKAPMIRGKMLPEETPRGILNSNHAMVLEALVLIWQEQGCKYNQFPNGHVRCFCIAEVSKIIQLMNRQEKGQERQRIKRLVRDLAVQGYYIEFDKVKELESFELENIGFSFITNDYIKEGKGRGRTKLSIQFNPIFSKQLLNRRTVTRNPSILTHRSELAHRVRHYIEPILIKNSDKECAFPLQQLISELTLPEANWHKNSYERKRQFQKILPDLNGKQTSENQTINCQIQKGLQDYLLIAYLSQN